MILRQTALTLLAAVALFVAACGNSTTSPGIQPEIANDIDSFEYQVSNIQNYSGTQTYTWQNTGTTANLNFAAAGSTGEATLTVLDDAQVEVYRGTLTANGTFVTAAGASGSWSLRVDYASFSGTVNFRAEKAS